VVTLEQLMRAAPLVENHGKEATMPKTATPAKTAGRE
jgi:hypothetical protein